MIYVLINEKIYTNIDSLTDPHLFVKSWPSCWTQKTPVYVTQDYVSTALKSHSHWLKKHLAQDDLTGGRKFFFGP